MKTLLFRAVGSFATPLLLLTLASCTPPPAYADAFGGSPEAIRECHTLQMKNELRLQELLDRLEAQDMWREFLIDLFEKDPK